jgi:hypothetical protein
MQQRPFLDQEVELDWLQLVSDRLWKATLSYRHQLLPLLDADNARLGLQGLNTPLQPGLQGGYILQRLAYRLEQIRAHSLSIALPPEPAGAAKARLDRWQSNAQADSQNCEAIGPQHRILPRQLPRYANAYPSGCQAAQHDTDG